MPLPEEEVVGRAFGADLVGGFDHHTGKSVSVCFSSYNCWFLLQGHLVHLDFMPTTMTKSELACSGSWEEG